MNEENSLCKTCALLLKCDRAISENKKVYFCEHFKKTPNTSQSSNIINVCDFPERSENNMKNGLCKICRNRDVCGIQIPNGGVWHCDNFI